MSYLLLNEVYQRISGDSTVSSLAQDVARGSNPDNPQNLSSPLVSIERQGGPERDGGDGASKRAQIEIKIWGHGNKMTDAADRIADRIDELLLGDPFALSDGSRTLRLHNDTGWGDVPQPDPDTIHYRAEFQGNHWSQGRINALTS